MEVNLEKDLPEVQIPLTGEINRADLVQEVEAVHGLANFNDKAAMLAFMEEPVVIYLHESTNPNEEPSVFCAVNGEPAQPHNPWLLRGREYTIKRKYVEQLARAQTTTYAQPFQHDREPDRVNVLRPRRSMRYPFSVQHDANPKGREWLKRLMAA